MKTDLNCDLGEHEHPSRTRALMRLVSSANAACGGHAGTAASMARCVRLAREFGVRLGAHPGLPGSFGRSERAVTPPELKTLLLEQVSALKTVAREHKVRLRHIKLHGALYHLTEKDPALRRAYLQAVKQHWPGLIVYALAGGAVVRQARHMGLTAWGEAFADRAYLPDGTLVPRTEPGAVHTPIEALSQASALIHAGKVVTHGNGTLRIQAQTLCVHGDSPDAVKILAAIRRLI
jgi:UPF0271 protein